MPNPLIPDYAELEDYTYDPNKPVPSKLPPVQGIKEFISSITDPARRKFLESNINNQIPQLPDYAETESPSRLNRIATFANTPLADLRGNDTIRRATDEFQASHPTLGKIGNTAIDTISGLSTPLNLGLSAMTGGAVGMNELAAASENFANKQVLARIAKGLELPGRAAAAGMVGQGGYNLLAGEDLPTKLGGGLEAGLGALGLRSLSGPVPKMEVLPAEDQLPRLALPSPRPLHAPEGANQPYLVATNAREAPSSSLTDQQLVKNMTSSKNINEIKVAFDALKERGFFEPTKVAEGNFDAEAPIANKLKQLTSSTTEPSNINSKALEGEVLDESGRSIAPPQNTLPERPAGPWDNNAPNLPDYAEPDEPSNMQVPGSTNIAVGPKMDNTRMLDVLGTALYTRDRPSTVAKELFQNAADELKISGNKGPIRIAFRSSAINPETNKEAQSIIVKDHGRGMTRDQLYTIFTNVGETGKANEAEASGGFGFAKAAPLLGGDYVKIESITEENGQKLRHTFEGNPNQLKNQKVGVPLKTEAINSSTPTGFKVEVFFPEDKYLNQASRLVEETVKGSPGLKGIETYNSYGRNDSNLDKFLGGNLPDNDYKKTLEGLPIPAKKAQMKTPGADIDLHYELDNKTRSNGQVVVLNNGLYTQSLPINYTFGQDIPFVPDRIIANIKSTVEDSVEGYPWGANREELNRSVKDSIYKWVNENITKKALESRKNEIQTLYNNVKPIPGNKFVVLDSNDKYKPQELANVNNSPVMKHIANVMGGLLSDLHSAAGDLTIGDTEKFGFRIGEKGQGGINIKSGEPVQNGREKFMILINPFDAAIQAQTPIRTARRIAHIIVHEFTHNIAREEGAGYTWALSQVIDRLPIEKEFNATHAILAKIKGADGGFTPEFQNLLHEYTESRGRPESSPDILSRQRESELSPNEGQTAITGSSESNGEGITSEIRDRKKEQPVSDRPDRGRATAKLTNAMQEAIDARNQQEELYTKERGKRITVADKVKLTGEQGFYKQLSKLKGKLPKVEGVSIRGKLTQPDIDELFDTITNSSLNDRWAKINAKAGLAKLLDGKEVPEKSELKLLAQVFGNDIIELAGGLGVIGPDNIKKSFALVNKGANVMKSLMASVDFSMPLRQGLPLIWRKAYWKSFESMFKAWGSEEAFKASQLALEERPNFELGKAVGLKLTEVGQDITKREEAYISSWAEQMHIPGMPGYLDPIKGYSNLVKRSNMAAVAFLNQVRASTFDSLVGEAQTAGIPEEQIAPAVANFVNISTGRGNLRSLEKVAPELNIAFFSPRLISSRLTMLNPYYYVNADPFTRKQALKSLFAVAGAGLTVTGLAVLAGATSSDDPTSADFMKAKIGNTRLDVFGGFQQYIVAAARLIKGLVANKDVIGEVKQFTENRFSPLLSFIDSIAKGEHAYSPQGLGEGVTKDKPSAELINRFTPMLLGDLIDMYKDDPNLLKLGALGGLGALGANLQTYDSNQTRGKLRAPGKPKL